VNGLKEKTIVECGYFLLDDMLAAYKEMTITPEEAANPYILIAPSWQEDNIMDICIDGILRNLLPLQLQVIVRPHPQYVRHYPEKLDALRKNYRDFTNFCLQEDFSSNQTVFNADILVTDWSGIAYEYAFTTLKPCLFINTPMKVMNPDYRDIGLEPFDLVIRNQIGIALQPKETDQIADAIERLLHEPVFSKESIANLRDKSLYNVGCAASVGADYLIRRLIEISRR
jgi:Putative glycosyl/glycerophosphate transferases involved in teichoic acid biosynthesis TagF/TagB/EpsJ/RodC